MFLPKDRKFTMLSRNSTSPPIPFETGLNGGRLPVRWVDKSILVADQSLINPPYTPESVISASAALNGSSEDNARSANVERVRLVVHCPPFARSNGRSCRKNETGWELLRQRVRGRGLERVVRMS